MIEPMTCDPRAAGSMPIPTAAAEPLLEPPGVRAVSQGLRVGDGWDEANSVVTILATITAPASRSAATAAQSRLPSQAVNRPEPCPVGISAVSMMSLIPMGMPSMGDNVLPAFQRVPASSAALRAPSRLVETMAPTRSSCASIISRQRSRKSRGVSLPSLKAAVAAR